MIVQTDTRHSSGSIVGTGVLINVTKIGFKPTSVKLFNITDGSFAFWTESMGAGAALKQKAGATSAVAAGGAGVTALSNGFSLGADADLNAASDVIYFECWG